jgi:hypothetical protein
MKRLALALLLVSALPLSAGAKDTFQDLPGVRDPAEAKRKLIDPDCVSGIVTPWPSQAPERNGLGYRAYACEYGNVAVGSNRPPNLIEYRKYRERY